MNSHPETPDVNEAKLLPDFSESEMQSVLKFASNVVAKSSANRPLNDLPELNNRIAQLEVSGVFVTLKRNKRLRSCCGFVGPDQPLPYSLTHAATRTATADPRFPPVTERELPFLHVEVTILSQSEPIRASGRERAGCFEIGKHGLKIALGKRSALFLPVVAVEQGWNKVTFLKQLCRKAGLSETAWQDPQAVLSRFEGLSFGGPIPSEFHFKEPQNTLDDRQIAETIRQQVIGSIQGSMTNTQIDLTPQLNGVAANFSIENFPNLVIANCDYKKKLDLGATVFEIAKIAAQQYRTARIEDKVEANLKTQVILFDKPALHGTLADHDLRGLDPAAHTLMCIEGRRVGWMLNKRQPLVNTLRQLAKAAKIQNPSNTMVVSFRSTTSMDQMQHSNAPKPIAKPTVRPMAVAGKFYPLNKTDLDSLVDNCLANKPPTKRDADAVMLPHAGLIYSGKIAGDVLGQIRLPQDILIICPKHTRNGLDWAVSPHTGWQIPGAIVPSNLELANKIVRGVEHVEFDAAAHQYEHAIEVLLPLIHRLSPTSRVVGIAVGSGDSHRCQTFGKQLARLLDSLPVPPLLVISSDMNHFATDQRNRELDELALKAMHSGNPKLLLKTVRQNAISMCGVLPACMVMETLIARAQLQQIKTVAYDTSARVSQDYQRVVGYAGVIFERA